MEELIRIANAVGQLEKRASRTVEIEVGDERLGWDRRLKVFDFEASDFRWNTRMDVEITNPRTGGKMLFVNPHAEYDRENDITHWVLHGDKGVTLKIWND